MLGIEALITLLPSGLTITGHEGDLMHMLDASLRMVDGELPHLDFMTPIGILGFAPIAGWLSLGFMVGKATLLANMTMAVVMLPATWWIGASRLSMAQALLFGAVMIILLTAIVYGGEIKTISLSMYYNRWAWGITFLVLAAVLFPARVDIGERWVAPFLIGSGMAALAMLKMTFFVPLAPAIIVILLAQKQAGILLKSLLVGGAIAAALLVWLGGAFFAAYFDNLLVLTSATTERNAATNSFASIVAGSRSILGSFVLLGGLLVFRKSGHMQQGLVVLVLAPVFAYITYQNWGNDPKWLFILIMYFWVNLPSSSDRVTLNLPARQSIQTLIVVAATLIIPSGISLAVSPLRAALSSKEGFTKIPLPPQLADIWLKDRRIFNLPIRQVMDGMPPLLPLQEPVIINGYQFPDCSVAETIIPSGVAIARQIEALDYVRGRPVLTADILNMAWLLGDITRVKGAAPWYYGDTSGLDNTDFLAVPLCPVDTGLRRQMVTQFMDNGYGLVEVYRSSLLVLYRVIRPAPQDAPPDR